MRRLTTLLPVVLLVLSVLAPAATAQQEEDVPDVLVWTGTYGFRHPSITAAQTTLLELSQEGHFNATITEVPALLTADVLANYDVLMWVSTTGKPPMSEAQREEIIRFAGCGGGTVGFHAALDANYGWAEHAELFGAQFDSHPQNAGSGAPEMIVEDTDDPITDGWDGMDRFTFPDEYYRWRGAKGIDGVSLPREFGDTNVLLSLDEETVDEGIQDGPTPYEHHQPVAWTKTFRDRGRVYYNNMGHSESTWGDPAFQTALVNGVDWVSEVPLDTECLFGDEPLPPPPAPPAADVDTIGETCAVPELQERNNGTWEVSGAARALTVDGDTQQVAPGIVGGLGWGAQTWILDLSSVRAAAAEVTLTLEIPNPLDDYDLGVTTAWGWYGSDANAGATQEQVVLSDVPHCAYLHVTGDNMQATSTMAPTIVATVVPDEATDPTDPGMPGVTRITAVTGRPTDLALGWNDEEDTPACACALLARDDEFADALASGAAQSSGAPLLLTDRVSLSPGTADRLQALGITAVTILGGEAAVGPGVVADLQDLGIAVDRAAGDTRVLTALAVADQLVEDPHEVPLVLRAYGVEGNPTAAFADALAAGRAAAADGRPILLTDGNGLSPEVADWLRTRGTTQVIVVGGEAAVGAAVEQDLTDMDVMVERVAGDTRFATAVAVATDLLDIESAADADGVLLIDGGDPAAWAEGFVAAGSSHPGPIVLADDDRLPTETATWLGTDGDASVPLVCGALVDGAVCTDVATRLGHTG